MDRRNRRDGTDSRQFSALNPSVPAGWDGFKAHFYLGFAGSGRRAGSKAHFCLGFSVSGRSGRIQGTFLPWIRRFRPTGRIRPVGPDPRHFSALDPPVPAVRAGSKAVFCLGFAGSGRRAGSKAVFCLGSIGSGRSGRVQGTFLPWICRFRPAGTDSRQFSALDFPVPADGPHPRQFSALDPPVPAVRAGSKAVFCLGFAGSGRRAGSKALFCLGFAGSGRRTGSKAVFCLGFTGSGQARMAAYGGLR